MAELTITAERLNELKVKVKTEMQRRNSTEHKTSLSEYAGTSWDYTTIPKAGEPITDEHLSKVIDPLLKVNDFLYDNSLRTGKSGLELSLYKAEQFVDSLAAISKTASNSGCRGSCTGLCADACSSACTGCTNCTGGCSTACDKACSNNCGGGCSGCSDGCYSGCTNTCGSGCTTSMKY